MGPPKLLIMDDKLLKHLGYRPLSYCEKQKPILYIVRGPCGTGKSTIANHLSEQFMFSRSHDEIESPPVIEADNFWGPNYAFNKDFLGDAHKWCQLEVKREMIARTECIIVSNTSIKIRDVQVYADLARQFDYRFEIIRTPGPWDAKVLVKRNVHNVPLDVIQRFIDTYQHIPGEVLWDDPLVFERNK